MQVSRISKWALVAAVVPLTAGCVSVAEHRKLERRVVEMERGDSAAGGAERQRLADLAARIDSLSGALQRLEGRIEVTERRTQQALDEAKSARAEAASAGGAGAPAGPANSGPPMDPDANVSSGEVSAYRSAYAAWRAGDADACVDRFRDFLQNYPSSAYADDSAYWLADCYFKQGDYKTAVLRFDDVVNKYPTGNKAADALYRQGEALLRLGPGYGKAAGKAFQRVIQEYPESGRVGEAKRQLEILGSG